MKLQSIHIHPKPSTTVLSGGTETFRYYCQCNYDSDNHGTDCNIICNTELFKTSRYHGCKNSYNDLLDGHLRIDAKWSPTFH